MSTFPWQTWNSSPFSIERKQGKDPGTVILALSGPLTVRDVYSTLTPTAFNKILDLQPAPGQERPAKVILDLSNCPYMDSTGLGLVVKHHVHCQRNCVKLIAAALSPRVREVFKLTKIDAVVHICATVEEAEMN
jgi:anti-anti-sigma factor